ncbi:MAG: L-threonylcarbamoyladenylate synthase [Chloroflexi bacterium]|nr:L-threonylcarbamoyladenylate synthase [Chloroflexota bacterium]
MRTRILPAADTEAFAHAVRLLQNGKVVAYPTDTVYGLGANGFDERAIEQLYVVKERPREKAIPYLLANASDLDLVAERVPKVAWELVARFWPGGLTIVVPASGRVPRILAAGGSSVAVRLPNQLITRSLIDAVGAPLATTSANLSGADDPSTAGEAFAQMNGRIPLVLDGGATRGNVPSTVVDVTTDPPTVRRVGVIAVEEIERALGRSVVRPQPTGQSE